VTLFEDGEAVRHRTTGERAVFIRSVLSQEWKSVLRLDSGADWCVVRLFRQRDNGDKYNLLALWPISDMEHVSGVEQLADVGAELK